MRTKEFQNNLLNDFILLDCRLADHPKTSSCFVQYRESPDIDPRSFQSYSVGTQYPEVQPAIAFFDSKGQAQSMKIPIAYRHDPIPLAELNINLAVDSLLSQDQLKKIADALQLLAELFTYSVVHLEHRVQLSSPISERLGKALTEIRHEIGLTQAGLASRINRSRISISRWERGAQCPTAGPLYDWCQALGLLSPRTAALVKVINITPRLLQALREDPSSLRQLSPEQLERLVAERLDRMGFDVTLTGATSLRDGGIDLIAVPKVRTIGAFLLAGQVKHHRKDTRTGREAVDRLLAWKDSDFRLGLLVTNTEFTKDARWAAEQERNKAFLRLRDFEDLKRWLENNFWDERNWREIPDEITLAPGIVVPIPKPRIRNPEDLWPGLKFKLRE